jgi:hypothetical protein
VYCKGDRLHNIIEAKDNGTTLLYYSIIGA